jgi:hypothetical protein
MMLAVNPSLTPNELETGLELTAGTSPDPDVSRIVRADQAVRWAMAGQHPKPFAQITTKYPQTVPYGGLSSTTFSAQALLVDHDDTCCTYEWSSDVDGPMGKGSTIEYVFPHEGERTITVKAIDGSGAFSTASEKVLALGSRPNVHITSPTQDEVLFRDQAYKFHTEVSDANEPAGPDCAKVVWEEISTFAIKLGTGCSPVISFPKKGSYIVRATAIDETGDKNWDVRWIKVVDPPLHAPPAVTILSPDPGDSLAPSTTITLNASAVDPDGAGPVVGTWSVKNGSAVTTIGHGNTIQWKPGDNVPFHCGGSAVTLLFSATDGDGTSTAQVDVYVPYPAC